MKVENSTNEEIYTMIESAFLVISRFQETEQRFCASCGLQIRN